jgi:serine/threonine protein kinase
VNGVCKEFVLTVEASNNRRFTDPAKYTDPLGNDDTAFYVGTSYRFSPLKLNAAHTIPSDPSTSSVDDIEYTLKASSDGWFVSGQTGEMFGQFETAGNHTLTLFAVDASGAKVEVEEIDFNVQLVPVFGLVPDWSPNNMTQGELGRTFAHDEVWDGSLVQYAIGSTINFPPLALEMKDLFVNPDRGDYSKIIYKKSIAVYTANDDEKNGSGSGDELDLGNVGNGQRTRRSRRQMDLAQNIGLWLVDTETGEMLAQPERGGLYDISIIAADGAGNEVVVRTWSFAVESTDVQVPRYGPKGVDCENSGVREDNNFEFDKKFVCNCKGTGFEGENCEIKTGCQENEALINDVCTPFNLVVSSTGVRVHDDDAEFANPDNMTYYTPGEPYRIPPLVIDPATNYSSGTEKDLTYTMVATANGFFLNTKTGEMLGTFEDFDNKTATVLHTITLKAVDKSNVAQVVEIISFRLRYSDGDVAEYGPNGMVCSNGETIDLIPFDKSYVCNCNDTIYQGSNCNEPKPEASSLDAGVAATTSATAMGSLIGLVVLVLIGHKYHKYRESMKPVNFNLISDAMLSGGELSEEDFNRSRKPREILRKCIEKSEKVGEGAFGEVFKGYLDESMVGGVPGYMVACKSVMDPTGEGSKDLLQEAVVMAQVGTHRNLVSLIGVVTSGVPLLLIISLAENGSLQGLLKKRAVGEGKLAVAPGALPTKMDTDIALDVAEGMHHLVTHNLVHRDLAARNVLVDSQMNGKVADFGLSRSMENGENDYYKSSTGVFALRWTAPEAIQSLKFSQMTDIWAYGIVLLEIVIDGATPLMPLKNAEVMMQVQAGWISPMPEGCPDAFYGLMKKCWDFDPKKRPSFAKIIEILIDDDFIVECAEHEAVRRFSTGGHLHIEANPAPPTRTKWPQCDPSNDALYEVPESGGGAGTPDAENDSMYVVPGQTSPVSSAADAENDSMYVVPARNAINEGLYAVNDGSYDGPPAAALSMSAFNEVADYIPGMAEAIAVDESLVEEVNLNDAVHAALEELGTGILAELKAMGELPEKANTEDAEDDVYTSDVYESAGSLQDRANGMQEAVDSSMKAKPQQETELAFEAKLAAMNRHRSKYDELFASWKDDPWLEDLQVVHDRVSQHFPDQVPDQPNPWTENKIVPISKRYLTRILKVFGDDENGPTAEVSKGLMRIAMELNKPELRVVFAFGNLKKQARIFEKLLSYDGRFDKIRDYARASFEVIDLSVFPELVRMLAEQPEFQMVRAKNRLSAAWDPRDSAGYRDYQILVQVPSGWMLEVQIIPSQLYTLKRELGHKDYTAFRFLIEAGIRSRAKWGKSTKQVKQAFSVIRSLTAGATRPAAALASLPESDITNEVGQAVDPNYIDVSKIAEPAVTSPTEEVRVEEVDCDTSHANGREAAVAAGCSCSTVPSTPSTSAVAVSVHPVTPSLRTELESTASPMGDFLGNMTGVLPAKRIVPPLQSAQGGVIPPPPPKSQFSKKWTAKVAPENIAHI